MRNTTTSVVSDDALAARVERKADEMLAQLAAGTLDASVTRKGKVRLSEVTVGTSDIARLTNDALCDTAARKRITRDAADHIAELARRCVNEELKAATV